MVFILLVGQTTSLLQEKQDSLPTGCNGDISHLKINPHSPCKVTVGNMRRLVGMLCVRSGRDIFVTIVLEIRFNFGMEKREIKFLFCFLPELVSF